MMDWDEYNDYRRAIVDLKHKGFKLKKLKKVIKEMIEEEKYNDYTPVPQPLPEPKKTSPAPQVRQRAERLKITDEDHEAIKTWYGGVGIKADIAKNVMKQGWISAKQRVVLTKEDRPHRSYGYSTQGDYDIEADYEEAGFYGIDAWGDD